MNAYHCVKSHYPTSNIQHPTSTIQHLTTMLSTSKNALFPGHNHLLITSADDLTQGAWAIIKVLGHQHRWLAGGSDLEIGHFRGG